MQHHSSVSFATNGKCHVGYLTLWMQTNASPGEYPKQMQPRCCFGAKVLRPGNSPPGPRKPRP